MKFIDKIKNYFYDEEEEAAKESASLKGEQAVSKPKIEDFEEKNEITKVKETNLDAISERELFKSEPTFNFPIIFDDEDFKEEKVNTTRISPTKREQTKLVEQVETKVFKPSLNISPIYGVIDNDSKPKTNTSSDSLLNLYESSKKVDIDDVLGKVYDQSQVEIKREEYTETKTEKLEPKDDLSLDFFKNIKPDAEEETEIKTATTNESISNIDDQLKTIDELLENTDEDDFYSLVDGMYKDEESDN